MIEAKRVKELEKEVNKCVGGFDSEFNGIVAWIDLLEFFKDYAALKAENERLRREDSRSCDYRAAWGMCDRLDEVYELKTLAEKAEAENERLKKQLRLANIDQLQTEAELSAMRADNILFKEDVRRLVDITDSQKAQLAKQAPLVEAAMKVDTEIYLRPGEGDYGCSALVDRLIKELSNAKALHTGSRYVVIMSKLESGDLAALGQIKSILRAALALREEKK